MPKIEKLVKSSVAGKRYTAVMTDGTRISFGQKDPVHGTYIDHGDKDRRSKYLARHLANKREKQLIKNLVPSPALFSADLLWGKSTSLRKNVEELNKKLSP